MDCLILTKVRHDDGVLEKRSILQTKFWMPKLTAADDDDRRRAG